MPSKKGSSKKKAAPKKAAPKKVISKKKVRRHASCFAPGYHHWLRAPPRPDRSRVNPPLPAQAPPAKKVPAKKAVPKKKAAPAKKVPAKKAAPKKKSVRRGGSRTRSALSLIRFHLTNNSARSYRAGPGEAAPVPGRPSDCSDGHPQEEARQHAELRRDGLAGNNRGA